MATQRLSVLAAAAALEKFSAAELAAYTGVKPGTVAKILRRESRIFRPGTQEPVGPGRPPVIWTVGDPEGILAELEKERRDLARIQSRSGVVAQTGSRLADSRLYGEPSRLDLADALLMSADQAIARAVSGTDSEAQMTLARTGLNFARAAQKQIDVVDDSDPEVEKGRDRIRARIASAMALARLVQIHPRDSDFEPDLLLEAAQSIANLRRTMLASDVAIRLRELVVVLVNAGRLPPIMVITDRQSSPDALFPDVLGQNWLGQEVAVSKRGLKCLVWCEAWAKPLYDTRFLPGLVVAHKDTLASRHLVETLLQGSARTPFGVPVPDAATVIASMGHDADFAARVLTLGATYYPLGGHLEGLRPTMAQRVIQALNPPMAWSTADMQEADRAEVPALLRSRASDLAPLELTCGAPSGSRSSTEIPRAN